MNIRTVIQSQYLAALAMLKQAIVKCPPAMWDAPQDQDKCWFKAYHTLYYTHLYLQPSRKDFVRWKKHRKPDATSLLSREEVLEYLAFVQQEVFLRVPLLNFQAESDFRGFRIDTLEMQFLNIRHIQQHTGELYERLGVRMNIKLDWADYRHKKVK